MTALVIIHTSDLHGRLSKAAAQVLRQLKSAHGALLVDSGDALPLPNFLAVPWRLAVAARLAEARYDALALGNREWFFWAWGLAWTARGLPCPLVATNLALDERTGVKRQVLCATAGGQVAILGLARRMLPERSGPAPLGMVRWLPPTACLPAALAQARQRAQWVVVLSHLGLKEDLALARAGLGGDALLGGHDHLLLPGGVPGLATPLVHSGYYGRWATVTTLARTGQGLAARVKAVRLP